MAVSTLALGFNSLIEIDTGANNGAYSSDADIGGWVSGSLTVRRSNVDSTNVDTGGFEGKEYGIKGLSLSFECLDDQANDTAQDQLLADFDAGTKRWIRIKPRVGTGYLVYSAQFVINDASWTLEQNGIARFSMSADSNGTFTKADQ